MNECYALQFTNPVIVANLYDHFLFLSHSGQNCDKNFIVLLSLAAFYVTNRRHKCQSYAKFR